MRRQRLRRSRLTETGRQRVIEVVDTLSPSHLVSGQSLLLPLNMAFLDVLTDVVTHTVAQRSYLDYQHQRYGLSLSERFPDNAHALVHDRPVCANGQGAQRFGHGFA